MRTYSFVIEGQTVTVSARNLFTACSVAAEQFVSAR